MVLSSEALHLSLAHLNKTTTFARGNERRKQRKPRMRGDKTMGQEEVKW